MASTKTDTVAIIELKSDLSLEVKDQNGSSVDSMELGTIFKKLEQLTTLELKTPGFTLLRTRGSEIIRVIIDGRVYCFRWNGTTWVQTSCA